MNFFTKLKTAEPSLANHQQRPQQKHNENGVMDDSNRSGGSRGRGAFGLSDELGSNNRSNGIGEVIGNLLDMSGRAGGTGEGSNHHHGHGNNHFDDHQYSREDEDNNEDSHSLLESFGDPADRGNNKNDTTRTTTSSNDCASTDQSRNSIINSSFSTNTNMNNNLESLNSNLFELGRSTESLLRTMRLDVTMLTSREREMKETLGKLQGEWDILEGLLLEYRKQGCRRGCNGNNHANSSSRDENQQHHLQEQNPNNIEIITQQLNHERHKKVLSESSTSATTATSTSHSSPNDSHSNTVIRQQYYRDKHKSASTLKNNSNFDWGYDVDPELREEARRASLEKSGVAKDMLDQIGKKEAGGGGGGPGGGKGLLEWVRRKSVDLEGSRRESDGNASVTSSSQQESLLSRGSGSQWSLFGGRVRQLKQQDDSDTFSVMSAITSTSIDFSQRQAAGSMLPKPAGAAPQSPARRPMETNWQKLFRRKSLMINEAYECEEEGGANGIPDASERSGCGLSSHFGGSASSQNGHSIATSSSYGNLHPNATAINSINDIGKLPPLPPDHPYHRISEEELITTLSKLQLKLRGCDSAAVSLEQLVSLQKRNLVDLQHERNQLEKSTKSTSQQQQAELESLQQILEFSKVERRRKMRLLEEADQKRQRTQHREDMLQEELETVRMELSMLNTQVSQLERSRNDDLLANSLGTEMRSATRQRVLIVGGSGGDDDEEDSEEDDNNGRRRQRQQQQQQMQQRRRQEQQQQQHQMHSSQNNGAIIRAANSTEWKTSASNQHRGGQPDHMRMA